MSITIAKSGVTLGFFINKMKSTKFLSIMMMLVLVLGTAVSFSSCSSDGDDNGVVSGGIVGTWVWNYGDKGSCQEFTFLPDGTGTALDKSIHFGETYETLSYLKWRIEGNFMTIDFYHDKEHTSFEQEIKSEYKISGNTLQLLIGSKTETLTRK